MTFSSQTVTDATKLLGLGQNRDLEAIQTAFRRMAKEVHPDRQGGSDEALCRLISARDVLIEDLRRETLSLDRRLAPVFEAELLTISLEQAIHGADITHVTGIAGDIGHIEPENNSLATRNRLKIKLPKGLRNEDTLRIKDNDPEWPDHVFRIRIEGDEHVRAWGDDLWMTAHIDLKFFYYGGGTEIETPRGLQKIEIAPDTQRGASITIKGMGLPRTPTRQAGDLIVRLEARSHPAKPARELLDAFQKAWA